MVTKAEAEVLLPVLKTDLRITMTHDDANLTAKLMRSMDRINELMGVTLDFSIDLQARELLFNRVRYDYNSYLEEWPNNFASEILSLQLKYATEEMRADAP